MQPFSPDASLTLTPDYWQNNMLGLLMIIDFGSRAARMGEVFLGKTDISIKV
jgi:hypothetical protein